MKITIRKAFSLYCFDHGIWEATTEEYGTIYQNSDLKKVIKYVKDVQEAEVILSDRINQKIE